MHTPLHKWMTISLAAVATAILAAGCASTKEEGKEVSVQLTDLSAPARATVEKVTAGGHVDKIDKEKERGRTAYDVEATIGGKHLEYLIADDNGEVLGTEVPIAFGELPGPVQKSAEKYFGTTTGLTAMKGVEFGETQFEVEGPKNGKTVEVTFNPDGKQEH